MMFSAKFEEAIARLKELITPAITRKCGFSGGGTEVPLHSENPCGFVCFTGFLLSQE